MSPPFIISIASSFIQLQFITMAKVSALLLTLCLGVLVVLESSHLCFQHLWSEHLCPLQKLTVVGNPPDNSTSWRPARRHLDHGQVSAL